MKRKVAREWVKALRSGKYEQGVGRLSSKGKFCCLGVLCEIAPEGTADKIVGMHGFTVLYDDESSYLPESVQKYAGLRSASGVLFGLPQVAVYYSSLAVANDNAATFAEIADIIEKNWESL